MEVLLQKYGRQNIGGLFSCLVDAKDAASPLVRGTALLVRARELNDDMLKNACARLTLSAEGLRRKYKALYKDVDREREDELRGKKARETVCNVLLKLEYLSRRKQDPIEKGDCKEVVALFEMVALLLVNPSVDAYLDVIDFCDDSFGPKLRKSLDAVFDELEVEPHSRIRVGVEEEDVVARGAETEFVRDKKRIKNELTSKADAEQQEKEKRQKQQNQPASLGSLRKSEKTSKKSAAPAVAHPVVMKKFKIKRKSPQKNKQLD
jgi:hypothetical protein